MKKRIRVQLDFTIDIDEASIKLDTSHWADVPDEAWQQEYLGYQRRLFHAVLDHPPAFKFFLRYLISREIENIDWKTWREMFLGHSTLEAEDVLEDAVTTLSREDQAWFTDLLENDIFAENTEAFMRGFSVQRDAVAIGEIAGKEDEA